MTALRLALTELRRIGASRVGRLALVAMVLVPSIYGGLYLYANDDPYAISRADGNADRDADAGAHQHAAPAAVSPDFGGRESHPAVAFLRYLAGQHR